MRSGRKFQAIFTVYWSDEHSTHTQTRDRGGTWRWHTQHTLPVLVTASPCKCVRACVVWPSYIYSIYTMSKKQLIFGNNFRKCGPIFKILSLTGSWENALCTHRQRLPPHLRFVATLPCESRKSKKCYWFWQYLQQTVDMFLSTARGYAYAKIEYVSVRTYVSFEK